MTYSSKLLTDFEQARSTTLQPLPCNYRAKTLSETNQTTTAAQSIIEHEGKSSHRPSSLEDGARDDARQRPRIGGDHARLSLDDLKSIINGHAFARRIGRDLNAHVTIRLDRAPGFAWEHWSVWQGKLLDRLTQWLHRQGIPPAFLWVKESGRSNKTHLHMLLHLSDFVRQQPMAEEFIRETGHFIPDQPGHRAVVITGGDTGMNVPTMQAGALIYALKGIDPKAERLGVNIACALGIEPHRYGQHITGRLHRLSHSIDRTARRDAGWKEIRDLQHLRFHLHPTERF